MTPDEVSSLLRKNGFVLLKGRGKGSHKLYVKGERQTIVPGHKGDLPKGTLNAILKQAGLK